MDGIRFAHRVEELEVVDSDTLRATVRLDEYIRLPGIDVPKMGVPEQRTAAEVVMLAIRWWLRRQDHVSINPVSYDERRHRVRCAIYGSESKDLASWLLMERLAHPFDGHERRSWSAEELEYIEARRAEFQ